MLNFYNGSAAVLALAQNGDATLNRNLIFSTGALRQMLDLFQLDLNKKVKHLSKGMLVKLALLLAVSHEPEVLILDEPTNGVDPVSRRELWALLHEFVHGGMAVLISTPYMDEAERCGRVGLVHAGRLLLQGTPRDLLAGFEDEAYEVVGGAREAVDAALARSAQLLVLTQKGDGTWGAKAGARQPLTAWRVLRHVVGLTAGAQPAPA